MKLQPGYIVISSTKSLSPSPVSSHPHYAWLPCCSALERQSVMNNKSIFAASVMLLSAYSD